MDLPKPIATATTAEEPETGSCASDSLPPTIGKVSDTEDEEEEEQTRAIVAAMAQPHEEESSTITDKDMLELGFMFEGGQPTRREHFQWITADGRNIEVTLDVADDDPGAVQSGHYLWPAATLLANYLVQYYSNIPRQQQQQQQQQVPFDGKEQPALPLPVVVVELGAGCALCSCVAWQLWANTLQCMVLTDHDPGTLERARNNHETTLENLLDKNCLTEDDMHATINHLGSIPTHFEILEWGCAREAESIQDWVVEHSIPSQRSADYILGSDLIYDAAVVEPLFQTVQQLLGGNHNTTNNNGANHNKNYNNSTVGRFLLAQSFVYNKATEQEIDRCCQEMGFCRNILLEDKHGAHRIQEFYLVV
ncbi:hypothetical protein ACA910_005852 [Epithemia clementina (nom. ined.)]